MFVIGQAREMGAGHLRRRVAHLLGQAVDGFGHRLHGRRVFVGVHLRESITAGTRSALTPKSVSSTKQTLISHTGSFCGGSHLDDDAVVGRVGHLVAREDDVGITVELPGVGTGGGRRGQRVGSDVDAGSTRWRGGTIGTGTHIRTMFPKVWSSFCTT